MTKPLRAGAHRPLSCSNANSSASLTVCLHWRRWQKEAIFLWPVVHGGVSFSWPVRISSRSCCDGLTSDLLLPRAGAETQLLIQADFVQLWDIPSVKCHLFYIYSSEVTKWRTIFLLAPPWQSLYCPHRDIWKHNSKWNIIITFFLFFKLILFAFFLCF